MTQPVAQPDPPPSPEASAVRPRGGLLAVHAHPDDETLATGALLATWAGAGLPVTVVTCTRGERGEVIDTAAHPTGLAALEGDGPALAAHREREVAAAVAALGVADHVFLDTVGPAGAGDRYEDSGMAWVAPGIASTAADGVPEHAFVAVPLHDAAARLAAVVRDRRPRVVVTYEPGGGYGHPDHVRAHEVAVRGVGLAAEPAADGTPGWQVEELWAAVVPADDLRAARRELVTLPGGAVPGLVAPDPDEPVLPPVATWWPVAAAPAGARAGLVGVDVRPVLERVTAALRAHETQVQAVAPLPGRWVAGRCALSNDVLLPILVRETYAVVPPTASGAGAGSVGS